MSGFKLETLGPGEVARNWLFARFAAPANTLIQIWVCSLPSTTGHLKQGSRPKRRSLEERAFADRFDRVAPESGCEDYRQKRTAAQKAPVSKVTPQSIVQEMFPNAHKRPSL